MRRTFSLFTILLIFFFTACTFTETARNIATFSTLDITPTSDTSGLLMPITVTPAPAEDLLPTVEVRPTSTDTPGQNCLGLIEKPLSSLLLDYQLSVSRVDQKGQIRSSLYDVITQTHVDIRTDEYANTGLRNSIVVSPQGTVLAILEYLPGGIHKRRLSIISGDSQRLTRPWKANWARLSRWLDEEHLILLGSEEPITTIFVYNPFTDEERRYDLRYDDLDPVPVSDWEGQSITSINPSMTTVAYLRVTDNSLAVAMKDLQSGNILVEMTPMISTFPPVWSMTGEWLLIANATVFSMARDVSSGKAEFFRMGEGKITQISDLSSQYPGAIVEYYQMSSDETKVGFWLYQDYYKDPKNAHLAIMDLENGEVSELCIRANNPSQGPLWVPGASQFVVKVGDERSNNQIIFVDISDQSYTIVGNDVFEVFGWIKRNR